MFFNTSSYVFIDQISVKKLSDLIVNDQWSQGWRNMAEQDAVARFLWYPR